MPSKTVPDGKPEMAPVEVIVEGALESNDTIDPDPTNPNSVSAEACVTGDNVARAVRPSLTTLRIAGLRENCFHEDPKLPWPDLGTHGSKIRWHR